MASCSRCVVRQRYRHGLCAECLKAAPVPLVVCLHGCGRMAIKGGGRGLCKACYADREVRELYPKRVGPRYVERDVADATDHMTEAELDALIAERMLPENLPDWWAAEVERRQRADEIEAENEFGMIVVKALQFSRGRR